MSAAAAPDPSASANDPFGDAELEVSRALREEGVVEEEVPPLNLDTDVPEGFVVEERVWDALQELRRAKIESEAELRRRTAVLARMTAHMGTLTAADEEVLAAIHRCERERRALRDAETFNEGNMEVMVFLKQGADEVEQDAVVTDYSDALLVHRSVVEQENAEIVKLGNEKVGILTKMKDFRRSINFMVWQHRFLEQQAGDLEEHYTDLHMLRVTKELQAFIKGGHKGDKQKEALQKAEAKLEQMKKSAEEKVNKLKVQIAKVSKLSALKRDENRRLQTHCEELEASVSVRESIQRARAATAVDHNAAAVAQTRMAALTTRRKLVDLARAQTEEIEFLRGELDRLRQRTFPSFAHASALRGYNADQL